MITIDLMLKYTPLPISVQRKEEKDAQALYQQILSAMGSSTPQIIELTCEKQEDKKVAVFSDQVSAVIMSQKSGATSSGRVPGFFSAAVPE